jgi:hypothetical protein
MRAKNELHLLGVKHPKDVLKRRPPVLTLKQAVELMGDLPETKLKVRKGASFDKGIKTVRKRVAQLVGHIKGQLQKARQRSDVVERMKLRPRTERSTSSKWPRFFQKPTRLMYQEPRIA